MSDRFVEIITNAMEETDTKKVWKETDDVSTVVRGRSQHVFDVTKAIFLHAAKTGEHVAMNGTFAIGCPGDSEANVYLDESERLANEDHVQEISQEAGCKFALYPMGEEKYMDVIYEQIDFSKAEDVKVTPTHFATRLDGDVHAIFKTLEKAFQQVGEKVNHVTLTFSISANSPSNR
jgi:uncharacterized protein YqgV (UPF0045/DUF77 family)